MRVVTNWSEENLEVKESYLDIPKQLVRERKQLKNIGIREEL